jgi:hypothetical protein
VSQEKETALTSRSHFACSDGPDRLIGNHDIFPCLLANHLVDSVQLLRNHFNRDTLFSLLQTLSTAEDHTDSIFDRAFCLASDEIVFLA